MLKDCFSKADATEGEIVDLVETKDGAGEDDGGGKMPAVEKKVDVDMLEAERDKAIDEAKFWKKKYEDASSGEEIVNLKANNNRLD